MGRRLTLDEVLERLIELAKERGLLHTFEVLEYKNVRESRIRIDCSKHNTYETPSYSHYTQAAYGMSCCVRVTIRRSETISDRQVVHEEKLKLIAKERNHVILEICYVNRKDFVFTVLCKNHGTRHENVKYSNYTSINVTYGVNC